ncbi:MAG: hypothetical protein ACPGGH_03980 [Chitinophagales bacterium]
MRRTAFLTRILISGLRPSQLVVQVAGLLFSFVLMAIAMQGFIDYQSIKDASKEGIGEDIMILSKPVTETGFGDAEEVFFRQSELDSLDSLSSVIDVYPFQRNLVNMSLLIDVQGAPIRSDMFGVECVNPAIIDGIETDWSWSLTKDGMMDVPILLPKDFLRLSSVLTSGFISLAEDDLTSLRLKLLPSDSLRYPTKASFNARIAGYSDRISAVLVPCDFLEYLNTTFAYPQDKTDTLPKRVAVRFALERIVELKEYLLDHGYETNETKLRTGENAALFRGAFIAVGMLGFFVLLLSLTGVLLTVQLMLTRSKEQIESILIQGISPHSILMWYVKGLAILFLAVSIVAFFVVVAIKTQIVLPFLDGFSFAIEGQVLSWKTQVFLGVVVVTMVVVNAAMIFVELRRMFTR